MFLTVVHLFIHSFIPFRPIITVYNIEQDKLEIGLTRQKDHLQLEMLACFKTNVFKNIFLPAGCREAANCRYCFHSQAKNQVFRPAGATRCTDSDQTLHFRQAPRSAWLCKISCESVQTGGNAAPKISKISTFW